MFRVERLIQIMFVLLASMSGLLLGLGQRDVRLTGIAIVTSLLAFILNDWLGVVRFNKWIANLAAIVVTAYTLSGFFSAGSGMQLILIANLLVYLQAVLLFQKKSPRVCWQIMVLSLLQVVVAAAFNLEFEGGIFFFIYMLLAGVTMMLLALYADAWQIERKNEFTEKQIHKDSPAGPGVHLAPIAVFDQTCQSRTVLRRMSRHIAWLGVIGLVFTGVLFFAVPKSKTAWFGPKILPVSETGATKNISLDQEGLIALSADNVFRVWFTDPATDTPIFPENESYFRGMALSQIKIVDGHTTWLAPYNRVYESDYYTVIKPPVARRTITQRIVLESTQDPLIYSATPWMGHNDTQKEIEFCRPISALTRKRDPDPNNRGGENGKANRNIEYSPFPYILNVRVERTATGVRFHNSWPYSPVPYSRNMTDNPAETRHLTEMDRERYPTLVKLAGQLKENANSENHLRIARRIEQHFLQGNGYRYTLDFRTVDRDRSIDAVEDFVANHRQGHCEFYASAMVLMLRSQGIPARVVVGFRGGVVNETLGNYDVQKQHAHAWVEAYIRPADCGPDLQQNRYRSGTTSGSWLILDPTPASSDEIVDQWGSGGSALGMARNLWRDYVLGLNPESENDQMMQSIGNDPMAMLSSLFSDDFWQDQWNSSEINNPNSAWWYLRIVIPVALLLVIFFVLFVRGLRVAKRRQAGEKVPTSFIWNIIGNAISLVSPRLGRFVRGDSGEIQVVDFYQRLQRLLRSQGLQRKEAQTQLEFADVVSHHFESHSNHDEIQGLLRQLTDFFYGVRFGKNQLDASQQSEVDLALRQLEKAIQAPQPQKPTE